MISRPDFTCVSANIIEDTKAQVLDVMGINQRQTFISIDKRTQILRQTLLKFIKDDWLVNVAEIDAKKY